MLSTSSPRPDTINIFLASRKTRSAPPRSATTKSPHARPTNDPAPTTESPPAGASGACTEPAAGGKTGSTEAVGQRGDGPSASTTDKLEAVVQNPCDCSGVNKLAPSIFSVSRMSASDSTAGVPHLGGAGRDPPTPSSAAAESLAADPVACSAGSAELATCGGESTTLVAVGSYPASPGRDATSTDPWPARPKTSRSLASGNCSTKPAPHGGLSRRSSKPILGSRS